MTTIYIQFFSSSKDMQCKPFNQIVFVDIESFSTGFSVCERCVLIVTVSEHNIKSLTCYVFFKQGLQLTNSDDNIIRYWIIVMRYDKASYC